MTKAMTSNTSHIVLPKEHGFWRAIGRKSPVTITASNVDSLPSSTPSAVLWMIYSQLANGYSSVRLSPSTSRQVASLRKSRVVGIQGFVTMDEYDHSSS